MVSASELSPPPKVLTAYIVPNEGLRSSEVTVEAHFVRYLIPNWIIEKLGVELYVGATRGRFQLESETGSIKAITCGETVRIKYNHSESSRKGTTLEPAVSTNEADVKFGSWNRTEEKSDSAAFEHEEVPLTTTHRAPNRLEWWIDTPRALPCLSTFP